MTDIDLNHPYTPTALRELNDKIASQLDESSSSDFSQLLELVNERDSLINSHLASLNDEDKQVFAKHEIGVNNKLKELAQSLLGSSKDEVTRLVRGKAAVKKYK